MSKKAIKWLYHELPELVAKGILTQEFAGKIRQYYTEEKSASRTPVILIICGVLGALLIGLGIILLFAHNWEQFSRFTRAVLSFVPLVIGQGLVLWTLCKRPHSSAFKEGTATFLSFMVGASISLISQTYNIPGDTETFILTWMFLIVPLVYLMQASIPAAIYLIGITGWSGSHWHSPLIAALFWPLVTIIIPHFIWALRQEIYTIRTTILSLIMIICVSFGAGFSLVKTWPSFWIIIFPSIYAIFYSIGWHKFSGLTTNWQWPLRIIGAIGLFVLAFPLTFRYIWEDLDKGFDGISRNIFDIDVLPNRFISIVIIATAILFFYDNVKRKNLTVSLFSALPLLAFIGYLFHGESIVLPLLIFNAYLFILSISHIALGVRNNSLPTINIGMLMLAILIIARFFDSDINFIIKGLVFIISGIGFLATNVLLMRRRGGGE